MKYTLYTIIILFFFALSGCGKDYLTEKPKAFLAPENSFDTKQSARLVLDGVYDGLQDRGWDYGLYSFMVLEQLGTDLNNSWIGDSFEGLADYTLTSNCINIYKYWTYSYDVVNRANMFLDNIDKVPMDDVLKNKYKGEALFLRSLMFFNLIRLFGDVPMPLTAAKSIELDQIQIARLPVAEVYTQIIKDLEFCEANLPLKDVSVGGEPFRLGEVSKSATEALLAQVYLYRASITKRDNKGNGIEDYTKAYDYANKVITSGKYTLEPYFPDVWRKNDNTNTEVIFAVQHKSGAGLGANGEGSMLPLYLGIRGNLTLGGAYSYPMTSIYGSTYFDRGDTVRRKWTTPHGNGIISVGGVNVIEETTTGLGYRWRHGKWRQFPLRQPYTGPGDYGIQVPVLRLGEMYLIVAEAQNEINRGPNATAIEAANMLRRRARNNNVGGVHADITPRVLTNNAAQLPDLVLSNYNYDSFTNYIFYEKAREMADEFCRYFDLQRWGKLVETIKHVGTSVNPVTWMTEPDYPAYQYIAEKHYLMPIPAAEIQANPRLTQNPGY